jgi:S-adenosylmethionine:tRNA ribosyltransferase-isomerase
VDVREFEFDLPSELIAQEPPAERGKSRLLHLDRITGEVRHTRIDKLPDLLHRGDVLVVNNTRVFPARLLGRRVPSGGAVECLLIAPSPSRTRVGPEWDQSGTGVGPEWDQSGTGVGPEYAEWEALMHPGQKLAPGARVVFEGIHTLHGEVLEQRYFGRRLVRLWTDDGATVDEAVDAIGHMPLPPYIKRGDRPDDRDRYQTVFADPRGSVAAPTAGLHFTPALLDTLAARGVERADITLHVGYGTFQPVRVDRVEDHRVHAERYNISEATAAAINNALVDGRRVIAVGTTTTRTLEVVAARHDGRLVAGEGETDLFIYPGFTFRVIGGLLTNFHLPQSSLLMLVSAFAGRERVLQAYRDAIAERYRFYSYGDAMLIL